MNITQLWTNTVAWVLQIGMLVGIGAAFPALLRFSRGGKAPAARLLHWQVLLLACITLPWMRTWRSEVIAVTHAPVAAVHGFSSAVPMPLSPVATIPSPSTIALCILGLGIAARLVWLAFGFVKLARYRRRGRELLLQPEWTGMAGSTTILVSDEISGPVTFGLFRPVVLLPASFPAMPATMREAILFHELLHVERRDWLFILGEELVRAVFWFHPAIWWVLAEIQLAREQTVDQAVIEATQARDPYVDTLLAMAGVTAELDLAPAPLFLRRRHLKQRVMGLIQEVRMSKTRMIATRVASLAMLTIACWFVTGTIPLHAGPQFVVDAPGVSVQLNGSQLLHRPALAYPAEAAAKGVEGTVVVQVRLDANGEVIDDAILSGPDALRRGVQQSILNWHFDKSAGDTTRVVNISFVKQPSPQTPTVTAIPMAVDPASQPATPRPVEIPVSAARMIQLQQGQSSPPPPPLPVSPPKIQSVMVNGLTAEARDQLLVRLPVHAGDVYTPELQKATLAATMEFDPHLSVIMSLVPDGWLVRIDTPEARSPGVSVSLNSTPSGYQRVGGSVQAVNLISQTRPVYPPLAKMARQQGTVKFEVMIAKEGAVEDVKVISGPPLLIPSAIEAVKKWVYKPTLLNGNPVAVATTVDVTFSLADQPDPAQ